MLIIASTIGVHICKWKSKETPGSSPQKRNLSNEVIISQSKYSHLFKVKCLFAPKGKIILPCDLKKKKKKCEQICQQIFTLLSSTCDETNYRKHSKRFLRTRGTTKLQVRFEGRLLLLKTLKCQSATAHTHTHTHTQECQHHTLYTILPTVS